ncbi:geranylgeranyl reductase family protein [Polymorphospora rubra]|uniref:geranylgeranyl reductase family protein n=1 Tax=Polymorphospora rubra TaxID=338584 RepID=UPI001BB3DA0C|nr:geranylgeranyl reductase family protein [Polymorphospora rubra]
MTAYDVAVVGAGPAGLSAAHTAARAGANVIVLERAEHPRYKTCGGGLIGLSLAALGDRIEVPAHDHIDAVTFTHDGRREFTRRDPGRTLVSMVRREEFDDRLRAAAAAAGAEIRQRVTVRALEQETDRVRVRLADGSEVAAAVVVGADGSSGITARHVGVEYGQVDLGLEVELPVPRDMQGRWRGRLLIDWGPIPGSYGWLFPKGDVFTVGVIAARGSVSARSAAQRSPAVANEDRSRGDDTRAYLRRFVDRLGLSGIEPVHDSGHLTRCRTDASPLRNGRVIVAGDAAGLLEPWTREGISFALRSGALAGAAAAGGDLDGYVTAVHEQLMPSMQAGRDLLAAFSRRPGVFHTLLGTPPGWQVFTRFCRGEPGFDRLVQRRPVRAALSMLR